MKIALCLYGYFNNREDVNSGIKGFDYIKDTILKYGDVDIFIHSWDVETKGLIRQLYQPKMSIIVEQEKFDTSAQSLIDEGFDRNSTIFKQCTLQSSFSFFYSRGESIRLKQTYEKQNKFKYDIVITARFDLGQRSGFHRGYNVSLMNFNPSLDMTQLYSAMWVQLNAGYADQWFFSNSENMDHFIDMYQQAKLDMRVGSDYHKALTTGWFDSNAEDEFSNELLKAGMFRTSNLVKYPTWQIINNHIYHKWFLKEKSLYEKSKFI